jgi:tripartite ATP-independent transporter DctM subunit
MIAIVLIVVFVAFLLLSMPVGFSMALASIVAVALSGLSMKTIPQMATVGVQSFPLMAVPFFILAGNLMNNGGITKRIYNFALSIVGHLPGGLGQVSVVASMIFSGISGSAAADAAGLGVIEIKAMSDEGYDKSFAAAIVAAAAVLGPIIPPSIIMVIYAIEANVSIAKMFLAGIVPGVTAGLVLMGTVYLLAKTGREKCPTRPRASLKDVWKATREGILSIMAPLIILLGMTGGVITPTEAGVLAVVYCLAIGFLYKELKLKDLPGILLDSALGTAQVMFMFAMASLFGWIVTVTRVPFIVSTALLGITSNQYILLGLIIIFLLILGCFMESIAGMIVVLPVLLPIILQLGIDPIHFGIIICFGMILGTLTPPMGAGLFIVSSIAGEKFESVLKKTWPFIFSLVITLLLITYVPQLSLWLPNLLIR